MTRIGITFDEVAKTADTILAHGENPTIEKVRRDLGTGSNSTISKYLNEWRTNRLIATHNSTAAQNIPPDPVHAAVNHVWEKIHHESETKIKTIQEQVKNEIEIAMLERNQAIEEKKQFQEKLDNAEKRLNQLSADKEILILDLKTLQQEYVLHQEKYKAKEAEFNLLKQESTNQITLLQTVYKKETDAKEALIAHIHESHKNSINQLAEIHENHRQQSLIDIDSIKVEKEKLKKLLEKFSSENQSLKEKLVESGEFIKALTKELEFIKNETHKKDKLLENNHDIVQCIQKIANDIENLNDSTIKNEILSQLLSVDKILNYQNDNLQYILKWVKKSQGVAEENEELFYG